MPFKALMPMTAVLLLFTVSLASARTWKSSDGGYSVDAELVKVEGDKVALKRADGQIITVPVNRLSTEDQEFLKSQATTTPKGAMDGNPEKALEAKGLRALSRGLILEEETQFSKDERDSSKLRRVLFMKDKELATIKKQEEMIRQRMTQMTQANVQFNAQLTQLGPSDITLNNRLVGAINANVAKSA